MEISDKVIDELLEDWLERDGDKFVKVRKEGRIGWEKLLDADSPYSSYYLEAPTEEDLIRRSYSMAYDMLIALELPYKVKLKVTNTDENFTDSKLVFVSTKVFDDKELEVGEQLDVFLGYVVHEGCHVLYTDFDLLKEHVKNPKWTKLHSYIANLLEDERIEDACGDDKPGFARFLEKTKAYVFDKVYLDMKAEPKGSSETEKEIYKFLNLLVRIIRFPRYLEEADILHFAPLLLEVKREMLPYPKTYEEVIEVTYNIYELIEHMVTEELKKHEDTSSMSESEIREKAKKSIEKMGDSISAKTRPLTGSAERVAESSSMSESEISDAIKESSTLGDEIEGHIELGSEKDTFFSHGLSNESIYKESVSRIKRFVPAIKKVIKNHCKEYKLIHRSMRSGVLDTTKLAEAYQGVSNVYIREGEVRTEKVSVVILIDESGSMDGKRIEAARDAAILLNESLSDIPQVELFIYGHTGDRRTYESTEMSIYREKGYCPKYALGSVDAHSQNRDGVAILEVAKRVRKQTPNQCLFFILSDGAPCADGYSGSSAMVHVRESVKKTESLGFNVIQVCISHSYDPAKMFRHFVIMEDMSTLATDLGKAIKKATVNAAKVTVR